MGLTPGARCPCLVARASSASRRGPRRGLFPRAQPQGQPWAELGALGPRRPHAAPPTQVTLSYGMFENKRNSVHIKGPFSVEADPSR